MSAIACRQPGCKGSIEEGYCNVCGLAAKTSASHSPTPVVPSRPSSITTGTGSTPVSRAGKGSRRTNRSSRSTTRKQLGAGLITLPELPSTDPEKAILSEPKVPERKRFCSACESPLRREAGFCGKCGQKYSFVPSLKPGDLIAGQYEVKGAIAYGGLGWIYLGFDNVLSRYVVLKGLLNANDVSSAAAAVAERKFLAAVKHPNIVGIYNFIESGREGYIVMEYVGGKTLKQIRKERGPLPVSEAIAYIHRILSAFSYLHQAGLVYCDFKPDNVMLEKDDVKLIDMGGVRRIDDMKGDIYGTVGYSAPEAGAGPTVASDLFTVGRTLAVLLADIHGFSNGHRYTLPSPAEEPLFRSQESLYRFLLKATAEKADDRFASADEMAEQLLGVLREVVAKETGVCRPNLSVYFGADLLTLESGDATEPVYPDYRHLPVPTFDASEPGFQLVASAKAMPDNRTRVAALRTALRRWPKSREVRLWLAAALADSAEVGDRREASDLLKALGDEDPWDWRVLWFQGRMHLAARNPEEARKQFDQVYFDLPGELAPKLGVGLAAEYAGQLDFAIKMYDLVSRTDSGLTSAVFGLARCLHAKGDRKAAVEALDRVPQSSSLYMRSRIEAARILARCDVSKPVPADLCRASAIVDGLNVEGMQRWHLKSQIASAALNLVSQNGQRNGVRPDPSLRIFGRPFENTQLRLCLEECLRSMARLATGEERIMLVDRANQVRPRTLV